MSTEPKFKFAEGPKSRLAYEFSAKIDQTRSSRGTLALYDIRDFRIVGADKPTD